MNKTIKTPKLKPAFDKVTTIDQRGNPVLLAKVELKLMHREVR